MLTPSIICDVISFCATGKCKKNLKNHGKEGVNLLGVNRNLKS